jgi:hypothetical protein
VVNLFTPRTLAFGEKFLVRDLLRQLDSFLARIERRRRREVEFRNQESLRSQKKKDTGASRSLPGFMASESEFSLNSRKPALPGGSSKAAPPTFREGGLM